MSLSSDAHSKQGSGSAGGGSKPALAMKAARKLVGVAARLRGLRRRRRIRMGTMTRKEIVAHVKKRLGETYSDAEIANDASVLIRLGLLAPKTNYKKAVLALLSDQVAGFYDPKQRRLNIAAWLPLKMQTGALVHEICHALQDQRFNLKRFTKPLKTNSDRQLARTAVVEGDCTGVMLEHALRKTGRDLSSLGPMIARLSRAVVSGRKSKAWRSAPRFLRETLAFPYMAGLRLVQRIRQKHSWAVINKLFYRPPLSTEQVLHYDKYWRRERPVRVRPGKLKALATDYKRVKRDTLGELQLRLLLELALSKAAAARAAAGWGGDRLVAFRRKDAAAPTLDKPEPAPLIVHLSTWDSDLDAIEFANGMRHVLRKRGLTPLAPTHANLWVYRGSGGEQWSAQRAGKHVLLLMGAPAALRAMLQSEVWRRYRVRWRRVRVRLAPLKRPSK